MFKPTDTELADRLVHLPGVHTLRALGASYNIHATLELRSFGHTAAAALRREGFAPFKRKYRRAVIVEWFPATAADNDNDA